MKHMKTILLICLIGLQGGLMAQIADNNNSNQNRNRNFRNGYNTGVQISGHVQLALPQSEFAEIYNGYPAGFAASLMLPMGRSGILRMGGEFAWNSMGTEKTLVELVDDAQNVIVGDMNVGTDQRSYHFITRFSPFTGAVRPYLDGFVGVRTYTTDTEIVATEDDGSYTSTTYSLSRDGVMSYGYAGGLMLGLGRSFFIDAKVQVVRGGNVTYVDQSTLVVDTDGDINFSLETTPTDIIIPQVGISLVF